MTRKNAIPTRDELERALYVDFEGPRDGPPVLLGVLQVIDGRERFAQYVIDRDFELAGRASGFEVLDPRTLFDRLAHDVSTSGALVVAWSRRELEVFQDEQLASPEAAKILGDAYVNAVTIVRRWRRLHAPGWMPAKPARPGAGRHRLSSYMKKMGYEVPPILGPNNTGQRLRYVRAMLADRGSYESLTRTAKGKWTRVLTHNRHDCYGMRFDACAPLMTSGAAPRSRAERVGHTLATGDTSQVVTDRRTHVRVGGSRHHLGSSPEGAPMSAPDASPTSPPPTTCAVPGCTREVLATTPKCRVHVVDDLRDAGEAIPFPDPELAGIDAVVVHTLRAAGVRDIADARNGAAGGVVLDLYTFVAPEREWAMGQIALDLLGAQLADLFGGTRLEPPMRFGPSILLRLAVNAPSDAGERLRESLSLALNAIMRELVGPEDGFQVAVEYAEDADDPTA